MTTTPRMLRAATLFVMLAAGRPRGAGAHLRAGLGEAVGATHYFGVICSTDGGYDTDHLFLQIQTQTANAPLVSTQVIKGNIATNTTDPVSGDAVASPPMRHRGGNGLYQVLVNKSGPGAVVFTVNVHCLDVTGTQHAGTDAVVYQYQDQ